MTQIAQIQKIVKANKTKAFGSYLAVPDLLTTSFKQFSWNGVSESILIENDNDTRYIEYSFDKRQIFRLEAGDITTHDDVDMKRIFMRGQTGGENFKLEVSYR